MAILTRVGHRERANQTSTDCGRAKRPLAEIIIAAVRKTPRRSTALRGCGTGIGTILAACETVHDHVDAGGVIGVVVRPTAAAAPSAEPTEQIINQRHPVHVAMMGMLFLFASLRAAHFVVDLYLGLQGSVKGALLGGFVNEFGRDYTQYQTTSKWREEARSLGLAPGALAEPWCFPLDSAITTRPHFAVVLWRCSFGSSGVFRIWDLGAMVREAATIMGEYATEGARPVHIPRTVVQLPPRPRCFLIVIGSRAPSQLSLTPSTSTPQTLVCLHPVLRPADRHEGSDWDARCRRGVCAECGRRQQQRMARGPRRCWSCRRGRVANTVDLAPHPHRPQPADGNAWGRSPSAVARAVEITGAAGATIWPGPLASCV
jgi:hypothetical protein